MDVRWRPEGTLTTSFEVLTLASRVELSDQLTLLRFPVGDGAIRSAYTRPGQYCSVRRNDAEKPGFFVLASSPGDEQVEFLVRSGGDLADGLRELSPGETLQVSLPAGKGFPLERADGKALWLLGAGSGIAALRPVAHLAIEQAERYSSLHFILGARSHESIPFRDDIPRWEKGGFEVSLAVSREAEASGDRRGDYVQDVFERQSSELGDALICVCGMSAMVDAIREVARSSGLDDDRVVTNY